jgi:hypothetical protein
MSGKFILSALAILAFALQLNAQISPGTDNEYCPNTNITFTVTLPGTGYTGINVTGWSSNVPAIVVTNAYNINTSTGNTVFNFVGRFIDVNNAQAFRVNYSVSNQASHVDYQFQKIKSFQTPDNVSKPQPTPTSITASRCVSQNFPISFPNVQFANPWVNPKQVYGTETSYEYLLPVGWILNGTTSTGSNWIAGTNNVTVTSDLSNGGSIRVRAVNSCGSGLINGEESVISVSRPRPALSISGDDFICSGSKNYTLSGNLPPGATVCWSSSNTNYATVPASPNNCGNQIAVSYVAPGTITLTATVTDCIETYPPITKNILIGPSVSGYYTITSNYHSPGVQYTLYNNNSPIWLPANQGFQVHAYLTSPGLQSATWSRAGNSYSFSWSSSGSNLNFSGSSGSAAYQQRNGIFDVFAQTACGNYSGTFTWPVIVQGWSFTLSASPNPARQNLLVSIGDESADVKALNKEENITMTLYNVNSSVIIKRWNFKNNQNRFNLNISSFRKGQYVLVVTKGKHQQSKQIFIE